MSRQSPGRIISLSRRTFSTADSAPPPPSSLWSRLLTGAILPLGVLPDPFLEGALVGVGGAGRRGGLSFCVSWSTLASDRPRHFGENPSQEPVPLRLSVQDLNEPSLAQVVGWGVPGTGEGSTVPAVPHLSSAFTSLLVIWRLLSYCSITKQNTCVWGAGEGGGDSRARRRLGAASRKATLPYSGPLDS